MKPLLWALITMRELDIEVGRINVNGGACALGHPIGGIRRAYPGDPNRCARSTRP